MNMAIPGSSCKNTKTPRSCSDEGSLLETLTHFFTCLTLHHQFVHSLLSDRNDRPTENDQQERTLKTPSNLIVSKTTDQVPNKETYLLRIAFLNRLCPFVLYATETIFEHPSWKTKGVPLNFWNTSHSVMMRKKSTYIKLSFRDFQNDYYYNY